jgi:hypothetical protein
MDGTWTYLNRLIPVNIEGKSVKLKNQYRGQVIQTSGFFNTLPQALLKFNRKKNIKKKKE